MAIATGLSATKAGFDLIKGVREILKRPQVDAAEVSARLLELQELMLDARNALSEADEENKKLSSRIADLLRMADFGKDLVPAHGLYWKDGFPYCPTCWEVNKMPVRLGGPVVLPNTRGVNRWTCAVHKVDFTTHYGAHAPSASPDLTTPAAPL
jgi:hypothetical protein